MSARCSVVILGGSPAAVALTQATLLAGAVVTVVRRHAEEAMDTLGQVCHGLRQVSNTSLRPGLVASTLSRLEVTVRLPREAAPFVAIEAAAGSEVCTTAGLRALESAYPDALLLTTSRATSVTHLGRSLSRPSRLCGLRLGRPADRHVEVLAGLATSPATVTAARLLAERLGLAPDVRADSVPAGPFRLTG